MKNEPEKIIKQKVIIDGKEQEIIAGTQDKYSGKKPNPLQRIFDNRFKKILKNLTAKPENILEIGCGEGHIIELVRDIYPNSHYVAVDIDKQLLIEAEKRGANETHLIQQEPIKLSYEDNTFDLILMMEVLEHLHRPVEALKEVNRLTKSKFIASVPNEPWYRIGQFITLHNIKDFGNTPGHINHWSKKKFNKFLSQYFESEKIYTPGLWTMILANKIDK